MLNFDTLFTPRQKWRRRNHPIRDFAQHHMNAGKRRVSHGLFPSSRTSTLDQHLTARVSRNILGQDYLGPLNDALFRRGPMSFISSLKNPFM